MENNSKKAKLKYLKFSPILTIPFFMEYQKVNI